jgi:hypothetical protein
VSSHGQLAGLPASVLGPGGQRPSPVMTWETSGARALLSGCAATGMSRLRHVLNTMFNLCTCLTASVRAAVLALTCQVLTPSAGR